MTPVPTLADLRAALAAPQPTPEASRGRGVAAVAAVLRPAAASPELLFILRAEHPRDPWSGQMGWPGGRLDDHDPDALAAATREAREELGLELERDGELLGALAPARTHLRDEEGPRTVYPFVFALHRDVELRPNPEVQEAIWVPLAFLVDRRNRSRFVWRGRALPLVMPCIRFQGRVIWGLTLSMFDNLLERLHAAAPV